MNRLSACRRSRVLIGWGLWLLATATACGQTLPDPLVGSSQARPDTATRFRWKRLSVAGGFNVQPGRGQWMVDVSPLLTYRFAAPEGKRERWAAGLGLAYVHRRDNTPAGQVRQSSYGGRCLVQYGVSRWVALRAEGELLNGAPAASNGASATTGTRPTVEPGGRYWVFNPLVGGGITVPAKGRTGLSVIVLYNLNHASEPLNKSLYPSPWVVRTGVMF